MDDRQRDWEYRQTVERLAREDVTSERERSVVACPGARVGGWPVKVAGHVSYNVYNVRAVVLGGAGDTPSEIGSQMEAFNLAESFTTAGSLATGTYVVMVRVGSKNCLYAVP